MNNHPNRRKSKDNPYVLKVKEQKYFISFKDVNKKIHIIEINEELYQLFNKFELDDIRELHIYERHIEHSEIYEETLYHRTFNKGYNLETKILNKIFIEQIYFIINSHLSDTDKIRLKLYFFENLTLNEIAKMQGVSHQAVSKSIKRSLKNIKDKINN